MRWPWQITCPTCGSGPGYPCRDSTGAQLVGRYHHAREDYARRSA